MILHRLAAFAMLFSLLPLCAWAQALPAPGYGSIPLPADCGCHASPVGSVPPVAVPVPALSLCDPCRTAGPIGIWREAYPVVTPVTSYRQVTVDEGSYQMVWISKPVTRTVAETTYRQSVAYRDVPYTALAPYRRFASRLWPPSGIVGHPAPVPAVVVDPCQTAMLSPLVPQPQPDASTAPAPSAPLQGAPAPQRDRQVPSPYEATAPAQSTSARPGAGVESGDASEWTTVRRRAAASDNSIEQQRHELPAGSSGPARHTFGPVPSAATVWQGGVYR